MRKLIALSVAAIVAGSLFTIGIYHFTNSGGERAYVLHCPTATPGRYVVKSNVDQTCYSYRLDGSDKQSVSLKCPDPTGLCGNPLDPRWAQYQDQGPYLQPPTPQHRGWHFDVWSFVIGLLFQFGGTLLLAYFLQQRRKSRKGTKVAYQAGLGNPNYSDRWVYEDDTGDPE